MASLKEFLVKTWVLLELILTQEAYENIWEDYKHVVDFVLEKWSTEKERTTPVVKQWLGSVVGTEDWTSMDMVELEKSLHEKKNYRAFRVATASMTRSDNQDSRLKDLLQLFMNSPRLKFAWYSLINAFFHNCEGSGRRIVVKGLFKTKPSTRLEQLLFVSIIGQIKNMSKPARNGRSYNLDMANGQRIGWAVQTVLRAWDALAKYFCFVDLEQMILPYITFDGNLGRFVAIPRRDIGYLPRKNEKMFDFPLHPTTVRTETFQYAVDLDDEIDGHIRQLVTSCLEDCISIAADMELYALSKSDKWIRMEMFQLQQNQLPSRFHQFPMERMTIIREEVKKLGLVRVIPPSLQLLHSVKLEDIPVSSDREPTGTNPPPSNVNIPARHMKDIASSSNTKRVTTPTEEDEDFQPPKKMRTSKSDIDLVELLDPIHDFLSPFAHMHCCSFEELPELHKLLGLEDLTNSVQFLLTDPPYNVRRNRGSEDSHYDSITFQQMKEVSQIASEILREGGHGIIFCAHDQILQWKEALSIPMRLHQGHRDPTNVLTVDPVPLHIVRNPNYFSANPGRTSCTLVNTVEYAIHFKKNGLPYNMEEQMVNYRSFNYVKSSFQGFRNVIDRVRGPLPGEQVRVPSGSSGGTKALRNEQKPLALLKELVSRFSQPGDIVVDLFSGTFSTAVACFQLEKHRRFVGCEQDTNCFEIARDFVTKRFAESIVDGINDIDTPASIKLKAVELGKRKVLKKSGDPKWYAPAGLPPFQRFPTQLMRFLSAVCKDVRLFTECSDRPFHLWPSRYQSVTQQIDIEQVLCLEAASYGLVLHSSNGSDEKLFCFTTRSFHAGDLVCYCYGTIVYYNLEDRTVTKKKYEEGILQVDQEEFKLYGITLGIHGNRFKEVEERNISLVPAAFCPCRYIYNFGNRHGSSSSETHREPNVSLIQTTANLNHPNKLLPYNLFEVRAKKDIQCGAMLVLDNNPSRKTPLVTDVIEID